MSIMSSQNDYWQCKKCDKKYTDVDNKWCKSCQRNNLKNNFTNWTSENEEIDNFIQEMQLKINKYNIIVFEWMPYNQFNNINKISEDYFAKVYSAIWKDGPLCYDKSEYEYVRKFENMKVTLKCLRNSQIIIPKFLNEV